MDNGGTAPNERKGVLALALGATGVVYGDIGTSPLYAIKESLKAASATGNLREDVLGVLSMVFWAATIVVSIKYIGLLMRADNKGEGGILALMALSLRSDKHTGMRRTLALSAAVCGAALFYGDAILTPSISVLSAVEGLSVIEPSLADVVVPVAIVILIALFAIQALGTRLIGLAAGPIMVVYFVTIAILGLTHISDTPSVMLAVNPIYAALFVIEHPYIGFVTLGAVFLAVTGAEAVYADMGHYGGPAIRLAWFCLVFPCLILNYFGQGAMVLAKPETLINPFFLMAPEWALVPLVILATLATVIASQAMISGAFSLTRQAIQLGMLPRMHVSHTSASERGQIYIPTVNWALMIAVALVVFNFKTSESLANAYGIAVSGTMICTSILAYLAMRNFWGWSRIKTLLVLSPLAAIDVLFFVANALKVIHGGWLPLLVALGLVVIIWTWRSGRRILTGLRREHDIPIADFIASIASSSVHRIKTTAVFMAADEGATPTALLHNLKHNQVLHARNVLVTVVTEDIPRVARASQIEEEHLGGNFWRVRIHYGFMERPNVPSALGRAKLDGAPVDLMQTSFFLGRETLVPSVRPRMDLAREWLFIALSRLAQSAPDYFRIPANRVIEVGTKIEM